MPFEDPIITSNILAEGSIFGEPEQLEFTSEDAYNKGKVADWQRGKMPADYGSPTWGGNEDWAQIEGLYRSNMADPRFQYLDKRLMGNWQGEVDAMNAALAMPSMAEQQQSMAMSDAAGVGIAGSAGGAMGQMQNMGAQANQASAGVGQASAARAQESLGKLDVMQNQAQRRNDIILQAQDLYNQSLGAGASNLQGYMRGMDDVNRMRQQGEADWGESMGQVMQIGGSIIGEFGSDERLKQDIDKVLSKEPEDDRMEILKGVGGMMNAAGGIVSQFARGKPTSQTPYGAPVGNVNMSSRYIPRLSGVETKEDIQPVTQSDVRMGSPRTDIIHDLSDIEGYSYKYNDKADNILGQKVSGQPRLGVMAQQVGQRNPEMIGEVAGYMTIKPDEGLGKVLAASGEQNRQFLELEPKLMLLEQLLNQRVG